MTHDKKHIGSIFGEVLGIIIGTIVLLYILPLLPFTTGIYINWLPIGFGAMVATAMVRIATHIVRITAIVRMLTITVHVISIYSTNTLKMIFPFDFTRIRMPQLNILFPIALDIALYALALAILIEFIKLLTFSPLKRYQ